MSARNAPRRLAVRLPAGPPCLTVKEPPLTLAGIFDVGLPAPMKFRVGNPKAPVGTARYLLRETVVRGDRQTLIRISKRWYAWSDGAWAVRDEEQVEALIYRFLLDRGWPVGLKHVNAILRLMRLELAWPPPAIRCAP